MNQTEVDIGVGNMYKEFLGDGNIVESNTRNNTDTNNSHNSDNGDNDDGNIKNNSTNNYENNLNIKDINDESKESYFKVNELPFNFDTWQADFIISHTYKR